MKCCGCRKDVSEWSDYLNPEPGQFWHPSCWGYIDWHVENERGGNPRPMTPDEKARYITEHTVRVPDADYASHEGH